MGYRYIGNKTRLVPFLLDEIRDVVEPGAIIADPMTGTASVSEALRVAGYRVIAADIMTFSYHHARVRLLLNAPPSFDGLGRRTYAEVIRELNNLPPRLGLFAREYSPGGTPGNGAAPRKYFSNENAARIDAVRDQVYRWTEGLAISDLENSLLLHDLIMAVNDVANIAGTYGHFRSSWSRASKKPLRIRETIFVPDRNIDHDVRLGKVEDLAPAISADLCYLDPPYVKRQYAANYHILETIARGDNPQALGVSGLRDWWDQHSAFCSKVQIRDAFATVLGKMDCGYFLVSYSEDALLSRDEMLEVLRGFGHVRVAEVPLQRFKSNSGGQGSTVTEYLFHLQRA